MPRSRSRWGIHWGGDQTRRGVLASLPCNLSHSALVAEGRAVWIYLYHIRASTFTSPPLLCNRTEIIALELMADWTSVSSLSFPSSSFDFVLSSHVQNGLNIRVHIDHSLHVVGIGELNSVHGTWDCESWGYNFAIWHAIHASWIS
jgi:hypothetical protein